MFFSIFNVFIHASLIYKKKINFIFNYEIKLKHLRDLKLQNAIFKQLSCGNFWKKMAFFKEKNGNFLNLNGNFPEGQVSSRSTVTV